MKVNNYNVSLYDTWEVMIQTEPNLLAINDGRIYITYQELKEMIKLMEECAKQSQVS